MVAVGIDAMEKLVIGDIEHIGVEREVIAAVSKIFAATQCRSEIRAVSG